MSDTNKILLYVNSVTETGTGLVRLLGDGSDVGGASRLSMGTPLCGTGTPQLDPLRNEINIDVSMPSLLEVGEQV